MMILKYPNTDRGNCMDKGFLYNYKNTKVNDK